MDKKLLDLNGVKVYTKADVIDAMNLIGQDVYMSDYADFEEYYKHGLIGIRFVEGDPYAFVGSDFDAYKYFILAKDAERVSKGKTLDGLDATFAIIDELHLEHSGETKNLIK